MGLPVPKLVRMRSIDGQQELTKWADDKSSGFDVSIP